MGEMKRRRGGLVDASLVVVVGRFKLWNNR